MSRRRGADGWSTRYAGIAVGRPTRRARSRSVPLEESDDLSTLAFGGPEICSPCFGDGKTGLPFRRDGGPLTQGMAGALDPGPTAAPDGYVGRRLSADGTHLVFGSDLRLRGRLEHGGDVSIYHRNLITGVTHVVSKTPAARTCPASRAPATATRRATPTDRRPRRVRRRLRASSSPSGSRPMRRGNDYWHPYMNIDDSTSSVDLAPGATSGVLFDGMTADGSSVLYTTVDPLTADDHDNSADIYRADVSAGGEVIHT